MRLCRAITTFLFLTIIMSIVPSVVSSPIAQSDIVTYGNISYGDMPPPDGSLSRLHVSGNKVVNAQGQQVLLRGAAGGAYGNWLGDSQEQQNQYTYMREWGCSTHMFVVPMPPFWDMPDLDILEANVEWAAANGMYSLIDCYESWHVGDIFGTFTEADWTTWKNAWATVATRFVGNPNVIYGIAVEPAGISAQTWVTRARECIDVIRAIDPDVIIVCEALTVNYWLDDGLNYQRTIGINRPNIIFDLHMYLFQNDYTTDTSYSGLLAYLDAKGVIWCHDNGYPVISQQCGYDSRNANGETWCRNLLQLYNDYDFSYTNWVWGPVKTDSEWLNLCTDWYGTPSVQGLVLQEYL